MNLLLINFKRLLFLIYWWLLSSSIIFLDDLFLAYIFIAVYVSTDTKQKKCVWIYWLYNLEVTIFLISLFFS